MNRCLLLLPLSLALVNCKSPDPDDPWFQLDVNVVGEGRVEIQGDGPLVSCPPDCTFGTTDITDNDVILDAIPAPGWRFVRWTDDCDGIEGTYQVSVDEGAARGGYYECGATFEEVPVQDPPDLSFAPWVATLQNCGPGPTGDLECSDLEEAFFWLIAPTPELEASVIRGPGGHCEAFTDVQSFTSEDIGPIAYTSSTLDVTFQFDNGSYIPETPITTPPFDAKGDSPVLDFGDDNYGFIIPTGDVTLTDNGGDGVRFVTDVVSEGEHDLLVIRGGTGPGEGFAQITCLFDGSESMPVLHEEATELGVQINMDAYVYFVGKATVAENGGGGVAVAARLLVVDASTLPE